MSDKNRSRVYYEPQHNRWHVSFECPVIRESDDIELVLMRVPPLHSRACSVCANLAESCD